MFRYRTVLKAAEAEQTIERSRFIGHVQPVENREEAEAFFAEVRAAYKDATHNVPAMVIGEHFETQWASDDGEPQGTSGAPMVQMLVKEGITNVALMITRYFGGIKLGTGGLVRAYTGTAKLAMEEAGLCRMAEREILTVTLDYTYYGKLQNLAEGGDFCLAAPRFEEQVTVELETEPERVAGLEATLANLTGGRSQILGRRSALVKVPEQA